MLFAQTNKRRVTVTRVGYGVPSCSNWQSPNGCIPNETFELGSCILYCSLCPIVLPGPLANCGEVGGTWKSSLCLGVSPYPLCPSDSRQFSSLLFALAGSPLSDLTSQVKLFQGFLLCFLHRIPSGNSGGSFLSPEFTCIVFTMLFYKVTSSGMRLRTSPCLGVGT